MLALEHRELPPSLHFEEPNPKIDFASGPFYVNARLQPWTTTDGGPRRAGISSFGIGGTNAHIVLEEAPAAAEAAPISGPHLLVLSARTRAALQLVKATKVIRFVRIETIERDKPKTERVVDTGPSPLRTNRKSAESRLTVKPVIERRIR